LNALIGPRHRIKNEYLNQRWFDYTGSTPDQSLGYGWLEALHPDNKARTPEEWAQARERAESFEAEYRLRRADGAYRWHLVLAMPLRDASDGAVGWSGSTRMRLRASGKDWRRR
jgi:PAS domain S-box-containing protein